MPYASYALGPEHDKFLLEAYFRSGERDASGEWRYSMLSCAEQFDKEFPDIQQHYDVLSRYVNRLVRRFRERGTVTKRHSTGRPSLLMNVQAHLDANPNLSVRELMAETGLSYGTCQKAKKMYKQAAEDIDNSTEEQLKTVFVDTKDFV